jgi:hypothetical protein
MPHRLDPPAPAAPGRREPTDEELDQYIRVRLALIGIDLEVLPESDPAAPVDRTRVMRSVRQLLRSTVPALSDYRLDPQDFPPTLYPAHLPEVRTAGGGDGGSE